MKIGIQELGTKKRKNDFNIYANLMFLNVYMLPNELVLPTQVNFAGSCNIRLKDIAAN